MLLMIKLSPACTCLSVYLFVCLIGVNWNWPGINYFLAVIFKVNLPAIFFWHYLFCFAHSWCCSRLFLFGPFLLCSFLQCIHLLVNFPEQWDLICKPSVKRATMKYIHVNHFKRLENLIAGSVRSVLLKISFFLVFFKSNLAIIPCQCFTWLERYW